MKDIENAVYQAHTNIIKILEQYFKDLEPEHYSIEKYENVMGNVKAQMARTEGFITGKISAAQKEPLSIKL